MSRIKRSITMVIISFLSLATTEVGWAQDNLSAGVAENRDPRLVEAELRAAIAEQEKNEAEARRAKIEADIAASLAKYPSSNTAGIDGSITVNDRAGYYAEVLAYDSLTAGADTIVQTLSTATLGGSLQLPAGSSIILIDTLELSNESAQHQLIKNELKRVIDKLTFLNTNSEIIRYTQDSDRNGFLNIVAGQQESIGTALLALPSALGFARDVSRFFQSEVSLQNRTVALNETTLKANLSRALLAKGMRPILPGTSINQLGSFSAEYQTMISLRATIDQRKLIAESYAARKKTELDVEKAAQQEIVASATAKIGELNKEKKPTAVEESKKGSAEFKVKLIDASLLELEKRRTLIEGYLNAGLKEADDLVTALTTPNAAGVTPIQSVAVIDLIRSDSSHKLLYAEIVSQGAEIQTTKKAFKGDVAYIGGASISYLLLNSSGNVLAAGTESKLKSEEFKRSKSVEGMSRP